MSRFDKSPRFRLSAHNCNVSGPSKYDDTDDTSVETSSSVGSESNGAHSHTHHHHDDNNHNNIHDSALDCTDLDDATIDDAIAHITKSDYRLQPFTWDQLCQQCRDNPHGFYTTTLPRSALNQLLYNRFRQTVARQWTSLDDYILCTKFHFDQRHDPHTGLRRAHPSWSDLVPPNNHNHQDPNKGRRHVIAVAPNDFPYYIADNMEHWVLWKLGGSHCTDHDVARAQHQIQCHLQTQKQQVAVDFVCFANPPTCKSVPDIDHVQIFCLKQPLTTTTTTTGRRQGT